MDKMCNVWAIIIQIQSVVVLLCNYFPGEKSFAYNLFCLNILFQVIWESY